MDSSNSTVRSLISRASSYIKDSLRSRSSRRTALPLIVTVSELCDLAASRGPESVTRLAEWGGLNELCEKLRTSADEGLMNNNGEFEMRKAAFGENRIPPPRSKSYWQLAWNAFTDLTLLILTVSAIISIALSFYKPEELPDEVHKLGFALQIGDPYGWVEGAAILAAVISIVNVAAWNDWQKERQFRELQQKVQSDTLYMVIRGGSVRQVRKAEIVVGDLVPLKYGDVIPVDGILVHGNDLRVDESSLTGEAELVVKQPDRDVTLLSGTRIMEGSGRMITIAVGVNSQAGKIFALLSGSHESEFDKSEKAKSKSAAGSSKENKVASLRSYGSLGGNGARRSMQRPNASLKRNNDQVAEDEEDDDAKQVSENLLQGKLEQISRYLALLGTGVAVATFLIQTLRFVIQFFAIYRFGWDYAYISVIVDYFINGIIILVIAIPEGLPVAVTIALAYSIRRMLKDHNLVRHLYACSTMGNATTICTDKTGTLTANRMSVVSTYLAGRFSLNRAALNDEFPPKVRDVLLTAISVNSSYTSSVEVSQVAGEMPIQVGNKTECALLGYVLTLGASYESIREVYPEHKHHKVFTFNSARKCMSTVLRNSETSTFVMYTKGAPEKVLTYCSSTYDQAGESIPFTAENCAKIEHDVINKMAELSLRTIAIAVREFVVEPDWTDEESIFAEMAFVGIFGIEDPLRPEVPAAIAACKHAGVAVTMVTGDNINTAVSIARKCGILPQYSTRVLALDSTGFNKEIKDANGHVSQAKFDAIWPRLRVLARATPQDKYTLVKHAIASKTRLKGEVVAVTGDGTNDGPALRKADVGFAMGIAGTDVAKEASDIIVTDDNFSSIVQAIKWGRNVYDSITKFVQFQLTINVVALTIASIGSIILSSSPLQALQMLWINLIMDTLAALCLATEQPTDELLERKPYGRNEPIFNRQMLYNITCTAVYQLVILFTIIFAGPAIFDIDSNIVFSNGSPGVYTYEPTQHFTLMFNVFVLMSLFNEINCRKAHGECNVFRNLSTNFLFMIIWIVCVVVQACIIQFGGIVFVCEPLNLELWMWSLFLGVSSLIWYQLMVMAAWIARSVRKSKGRKTDANVDYAELSYSNKKKRREEETSLLA